MKQKFANAFSLALIVAMLFTSVGLASGVDVSVVDVNMPLDAVTLAPGASGDITINLTVTGNQIGTATFEVYRTWTLSGGTFTGSNPQEFIVAPRGSSDPATTFSTTGTVTVTAGHASGGPFTVTIGVFDITNTNATGAKLSAGQSDTYSVNVSAPPPPANTSPSLSLPANITTEATSGAGAAVSYTATASDTQDGSLTPSCSPASGSTFPLGTTAVNCSVTDSGGLSASDSFTITVQDTTAPTVTVPANMTVEATGPSGAAPTFSASASDLVSGPLAATCLPASGSTFPLGTTTVICSATDAAGNTGSASFTVTVRDTTAPAVTVPANLTVEATGPSGAAAAFTASANDLVDGSITPSCSPASGSTFALGTTTVNCSATDAANNTGNASFSVSVVDTTPPTVSVPANMTLEATGPSGAVATFSASASDLVDGALAATCAPTSGSTFPLGTTTVNCSATDAAGNTGSASFTVTVQDTTAPTLTLPSNMTVSATSAAGAVVTFSASATDIVDGSVAVTCTPASGSTFAPGTTTVNCSATDAAGNTASGSFNVSVKFQLLGFYNPVDMSGVYNTVKGGSTVPLKFEVFAGSTELTSTSVIQSFVQTKIACDGTAPLDDIEITSTGGTSLRYDTTGGQFIQNWQTPRQPGSCFRVTMTTQDGSSLIAFFKLK